jgi:NAD(P)-dependent dehydrogenase (short-subunit alcohol dehydrogenase family)
MAEEWNESNEELKEKVAIVTGASRGLGRAVAKGLAAAGAKVALFSRTADELEAVAEEIRREGGEALAMPGDVVGGSQVARLVSETVDRFGGVHILVNNAGIIGPARFLEDADPKAWSNTLAVNLTGAYHCCREVIPHMRSAGGGAIINVTSGLADMPFPHFCAYGASKAGLNQLTRSLSEEFREAGIRVNAVDPGILDTSMQARIRETGADTLRPEIHRRFLGFQKSGQLTPPEQLAPLFRYLASDESKHVTGRILTMADLDSLRS